MSEPNLAPSNPAPYTRKNPYLAELIDRQMLTKPGSEKETIHFVIDLGNSGITYTPGDSLGVLPRNPPELIDELMEVLKLDPNAVVQDRDGQSATFWQILYQKYVLNRANKKILAGLAERIPQGEQRNRLMELVDNDQSQSEYLYSRDYVDVLREFTEARFETPEEFISQLSPISPRLYSIASSAQAHPGQVQLCVAIVRYESHGRKKKGLATGFFADQIRLRTREIPVYVQESKSFRLPADPSRDIIMVGPGTGIAPFRAFLEQRALDGASGRNWLFFGEQHLATDFFYEEEFLGWQKSGHLKRLDLAFSRDQAQKIYVQNRMREQGRDLWRWLDGGAYFYVCGDARRMAKDVHQELINIAQTEGGLSPEAAAEFVNVTLMKTERRYLRDVY